MWNLAKCTAVVLATILVFAIIGALLYGIRTVLVVFLFAILFAYLLDPWISRLQGWTKVSRGSRGIAILELYVLLGIVLATSVVIIGPKVIDEGRTLGESLPGLLQRLSSGQIAHQIGAKHNWSYATQVWVEHLITEHSSSVLPWEREFAKHVALILQNVVWLVLIPILAVFFLKDGGQFAQDVVEAVESESQRQFLRGIFQDLNEMLAHFIRAQLILAAMSTFVYMGVLWLLRVPYPFALGSIAGLLEFVPIVGPLIGAITILGVAFLAGYQHLVVVTIFLGVWRVLQDYVTSPRIMGGKLEIHPLAAIFAVLAGGEIGGILGVYLSVPIMASLRIVLKRWKAYPGTNVKTSVRPIAA
jgi:predicted PurR-regulated permease PerM